MRLWLVSLALRVESEGGNGNKGQVGGVHPILILKKKSYS